MNDKQFFIPRHGSPLFYPDDPEVIFSGSGGRSSRRKFLKRAGGATAATAVGWLTSSRLAKAQENHSVSAVLLVCIEEPDEGEYEQADPGSWQAAQVAVQQTADGPDFKIHTDQVSLIGAHNDGIQWRMAHWLEFHDFPKRGDAKPASPQYPAVMNGNVTAHVAIIRSSFSYSTYESNVQHAIPPYKYTSYQRNPDSWANYTALNVTAPMPTTAQLAAMNTLNNQHPDDDLTEEEIEGLYNLVNGNGKDQNIFKVISDGSRISYHDAQAHSNVNGPHVVYSPDLSGGGPTEKVPIGWVFVTWSVKNFRLSSHAVFVPKWDSAANLTYSANLSGAIQGGPASIGASIGLSTTVQENHPPAAAGKTLQWSFMNLGENNYERLHNWMPPSPPTEGTLPQQDPFTLIHNI